MSAVYTTIDGELLSERRGGASTLYVPDTLGSLAEARDASGAKAYEAGYWAYGEVRSESGTNPSPGASRACWATSGISRGCGGRAFPSET